MNFRCWWLFASLQGSSEVGDCWFSCPSSIGEDQFETCLGDPVYRLPIILPYGEIDFSIYFVSEIIYNPWSPLLCVLPGECLSLLPLRNCFISGFCYLTLHFVCFESFPSKQDSSEGWHCTHRGPLSHTGHPALCVHSSLWFRHPCLKPCKCHPKGLKWAFFFSIISRIIYLVNYLPLDSQERSLV